MIVDVHGHTLDLAWRRGLPLDAPLGGATDVPLMRTAGVAVQLCPTWTPDRALSGPHAWSVAAPLPALVAMLDYLDAELAAKPGENVLVARTAADLRTAAASGRVALVLGMEGTDALGGDPAVLAALHARGLRHACLVHEHANEFGAASQVWEQGRMRPYDPALDPPGRLTERGRELVEEMDRLGILVDLTHLVEPAFSEVLEVARGPVLVSHGGTRRAAASLRYPSDAQIRAVASTGGLIGASPTPLGPGGGEPGIDLLLDTVDHLVDLVGADHVGIGTDFLDRAAGDLPGLGDIGDLPRVALDLARRGHGAEAVDGMLGGNFLRIFERVAG